MKFLAQCRKEIGPAPDPLGPIGVFDSGIGGLTVVAALRHLLPNEDVFYLGDVARIPYGGKSQETIERYSVEICKLLLAEHAKIIVVACSTSSALALLCLKELFPVVPIIGMVEIGAMAAVQASYDKRIGVIGTKATISSGAYERALHSICTGAYVVSKACPLLVPLVEEGMLKDSITHLALQRYLAPLLQNRIDTLLLGCTHYPLLYQAIKEVIGGSKVIVVDSGKNCALAVEQELKNSGMGRTLLHVGSLRIALTDAADGFLRIAAKALGLEIQDVELLSL